MLVVLRCCLDSTGCIDIPKYHFHRRHGIAFSSPRINNVVFSVISRALLLDIAALTRLTSQFNGLNFNRLRL